MHKPSYQACVGRFFYRQLCPTRSQLHYLQFRLKQHRPGHQQLLLQGLLRLLRSYRFGRP